MNKTAEQIVAEVDDLVRAVWSAWEDPETLSGLILKLSVLYAPIGNYLAQAREEERWEETMYKSAVNKGKIHYVSEGDSATLAESKSHEDHTQDKNDWVETQNRVDTLKLKREDVEKLIDAARSRLSLIKGDIQRGQL